MSKKYSNESLSFWELITTENPMTKIQELLDKDHISSLL